MQITKKIIENNVTNELIHIWYHGSRLILQKGVLKMMSVYPAGDSGGNGSEDRLW